MSTRARLYPIYLHGAILLRRYGLWLLPAIAIFLLGLLSSVVWLPEKAAQLHKTERAVTSARQQLQTMMSRPEQAGQRMLSPLASFRKNLLDPSQVNAVLAQIDSHAQSAGLSLDKVEYQYQNDAKGLFSTAQITLPAKGSYIGLRNFSLGVLRDIPSLSLESLQFKRAAITDTHCEAQLEFTLWLAPSGSAQLGHEKGPL